MVKYLNYIYFYLSIGITTSKSTIATYHWKNSFFPNLKKIVRLAKASKVWTYVIFSCAQQSWGATQQMQFRPYPFPNVWVSEVNEAQAQHSDIPGGYS